MICNVELTDMIPNRIILFSFMLSIYFSLAGGNSYR